MAGVNKCIIVGNLGRDPEVRTFANGGEIVSLRIATSETWRDKASGERKEKTEWHSVSITNEALCRVAKEYLRKGSTVYIEGQLETRKWQDQSGADRYSTEIMVKPFRGELTLLGGKGDGQRDDPGQSQGQATGGGYGDTHGSGYGAGGSAMSGGGRSDLGDEIPFAPEWR